MSTASKSSAAEPDSVTSAAPSAAPLDKEHVAAAVRVMKAFGMEEAYGKLTETMVQQIELALKARAETDPSFTPEKKKAFLEKVQELRTAMPKKIDFSKILTDVTTDTFAKCFTIKELTGMAAFYESPIGQRYGKDFSNNYQESFQLIMKAIEPKVDAALEQAAQEVLGPPPGPENPAEGAKPPAAPGKSGKSGASSGK